MAWCTETPRSWEFSQEIMFCSPPCKLLALKLRLWKLSSVLLCFWVLSHYNLVFVLFLNKHEGLKPTFCLQICATSWLQEIMPEVYPPPCGEQGKHIKSHCLGLCIVLIQSSSQQPLIGNIYFLGSLYFRASLLKEAGRSAFLSGKMLIDSSKPSQMADPGERGHHQQSLGRKGITGMWSWGKNKNAKNFGTLVL